MERWHLVVKNLLKKKELVLRNVFNSSHLKELDKKTFSQHSKDLLKDFLCCYFANECLPQIVNFLACVYSRRVKKSLVAISHSQRIQVKLNAVVIFEGHFHTPLLLKKQLCKDLKRHINAALIWSCKVLYVFYQRISFFCIFSCLFCNK